MRKVIIAATYQQAQHYHRQLPEAVIIYEARDLCGMRDFELYICGTPRDDEALIVQEALARGGVVRRGLDATPVKPKEDA